MRSRVRDRSGKPTAKRGLVTDSPPVGNAQKIKRIKGINLRVTKKPSLVLIYHNLINSFLELQIMYLHLHHKYFIIDMEVNNTKQIMLLC